MKVCTVGGCQSKPHARQLCVKHYNRAMKGKPLTGPGRPTPIDRLTSRLRQNGDCWEYTGHLDKRGYPRISVNNRSVLAYRYAYEFYIDPVPAGLELDHLCRNPSCCNPWHLEPVTHQINVQRGQAGYAPDDRCKHGHDLSDPANVYRHTAGRNGRKCRPCALARSKKQYEQQKEEAS